MIIGNGVQFGNGVAVQNFNPSTYYNTGSVQFNGSSQYLTVPANANLTLSGNFTVEGWVYLNSVSAAQPIMTYGTSGSATNLLFLFNPTVGLRWYYSGATSDINQGSTAGWASNTWYHIAAVRNGSTITLYRNGTSVASGTASTTYGSGFTLSVGGSVGDSVYFNGNISNFRVVNGTAVYTANFTPATTPLAAVAGTSLLTCQSSTSITDASTNAVAITNTGAATTSIYNPFGVGSAGSLTTGSTQFNGSSQYLTVPANAGFNIGTGNFTLEAWINVPNTQVGAIFATGPTASKNGFYISATGQIFYTIFNTGNYQIGTATVSANTWTHVAIVRVGSTMTAYINGTSIGNITNSSSVGDSTTVSYVGQFNSGNFFNGYISNFRFNNTAVYTANFTPSTTPLTAIAGTALLTCQSSTSATTDSSSNALTVTNTGTAVAVTANPFVGGSVLFNGSSYLETPSTSGAAFGTGNFTVELWFNNNSTGFYTNLFATVLAYSTSNTLRISTGGTNNTLQVASGGTLLLNASTTFNNSVWNHIALVRNSGTLKLYLNGVSVGSTTDNTSYVAGPFVLGNVTGAGGPYYFNGYMSNVRVTNTAVYTANFTPSTTPLTAIAGTVLLTCQSSSTITDASTNAFTITNTGSATATGLSPFAYPVVAAVAPVVSVAGQPSGSVQFNGTSQYLTAPTNTTFNLGTTFTIEFWAYRTASQAARVISRQDSSAPYNGYSIVIGEGSTNVWLFDASGTQISFTDTDLNKWNHYAWVVNGTSGVVYKNGVSVGTATQTAQTPTAQTTMYIGVRDNLTAYWPGYISNLRVVNGVAVYTSAFTPPTQPLSVVAGTALLTCQSQTSATTDATGLNTVTNNGTTLAVTASPFHN